VLAPSDGSIRDIVVAGDRIAIVFCNGRNSGPARRGRRNNGACCWRPSSLPPDRSAPLSLALIHPRGLIEKKCNIAASAGIGLTWRFDRFAARDLCLLGFVLSCLDGDFAF